MPLVFSSSTPRQKPDALDLIRKPNGGLTVGFHAELMGLSNRHWGVKPKVVEAVLPGAWLSSQSTSVAA